jgi:glucose/arabinose dehydrogenase
MFEICRRLSLRKTRCQPQNHARGSASSFRHKSAGNIPQPVPRPESEPRLIRTAPNGDFFVAESRSGEICVFRDITPKGKPERSEVFATGVNGPFRISVFPPGPDPQWIYVGKHGFRRALSRISLQMTFYEGKQFPAEYWRGVFASEHGSLNKSVCVGYDIDRRPAPSDRPCQRRIRNDRIRRGQ